MPRSSPAIRPWSPRRGHGLRVPTAQFVEYVGDLFGHPVDSLDLALADPSGGLGDPLPVVRVRHALTLPLATRTREDINAGVQQV